MASHKGRTPGCPHPSKAGSAPPESRRAAARLRFTGRDTAHFPSRDGEDNVWNRIHLIKSSINSRKKAQKTQKVEDAGQFGVC